MSTYEMYNWKKGGDSPACAILTHDDGRDRWRISIIPGLERTDYPLILELHAERGRLELDEAESERFLLGRVIPPNRQGIDWILERNGLDHWSLTGMLLLARGRWTQDPFGIREVPENRPT